MACLYDARGSFHVLRSKITIKLLCQTVWAPFWPESAGKWAVPNWGRFFRKALLNGFWSRLFYPTRTFAMFWIKKVSTNFLFCGPRKNIWTKSEKSSFRRFSPIFVFWALLLKIQTGITLSILGFRGSSSNSRELSTIPFNNMPIET